ncbi:30S ribosomal protein S5 [Simkania sp.]|uniref:30S ribosomal protein S5 n=1 Tax=Simkania sp. TaxID=34094 RepID=UPI003B529106
MAKNKRKRQEDFETEFEEKVLFINRCSKVVKGGRKFSFSALVIVGDGNGRVGVGFAKANEVADAIRKAGETSRKNILDFELEETTIPHEIISEWDGARVLLKPAMQGTGVIAGSQVRSVLEIGGVKDVVAKSLGCNNPINQVYATFKALSELKNRQETLAARGIEA